MKSAAELEAERDQRKAHVTSETAELVAALDAKKRELRRDADRACAELDDEHAEEMKARAMTMRAEERSALVDACRDFGDNPTRPKARKLLSASLDLGARRWHLLGKDFAPRALTFAFGELETERNPQAAVAFVRRFDPSAAYFPPEQDVQRAYLANDEIAFGLALDRLDASVRELGRSGEAKASPLTDATTARWAAMLAGDQDRLAELDRDAKEAAHAAVAASCEAERKHQRSILGRMRSAVGLFD